MFALLILFLCLEKKSTPELKAEMARLTIQRLLIRFLKYRALARRAVPPYEFVATICKRDRLKRGFFSS